MTLPNNILVIIENVNITIDNDSKEKNSYYSYFTYGCDCIKPLVVPAMVVGGTALAIYFGPAIAEVAVEAVIACAGFAWESVIVPLCTSLYPFSSAVTAENITLNTISAADLNSAWVIADSTYPQTLNPFSKYFIDVAAQQVVENIIPVTNSAPLDYIADFSAHYVTEETLGISSIPIISEVADAAYWLSSNLGWYASEVLGHAFENAGTLVAGAIAYEAASGLLR